MELVIRKLELEDLDAVLQIENQSYITPWSRGIFQHEIDQSQFGYYLAAFSERELVGYAGLWRIWREGHITNVTVQPSRRRKGIGLSLVITLLEYALSSSLRLITLEVRASNSAALDLYHLLGFEQVGIRKKYYLDNNEDAVIMHLSLHHAGQISKLLAEKKEHIQAKHHWSFQTCAAL